MRLDKQFAHPWPGLNRPDLFPFAVDLETEDVAVAGRPGTSVAGRCLWLDGKIIDDGTSFREWFEEQVVCHRYVLDGLVSKAGPTPPGAPAH